MRTRPERLEETDDVLDILVEAEGTPIEPDIEF
jgi:hypothetical protein